MRKSISILLIISLFISVISCKDDQCNLETESLLSLDIIVADPNLTNISYSNGLSIYSPAWSDSIDFSESLEFMPSPNQDNTTIIFTSNDTILKDTLYVYHQNTLRLLSPECGFVFDFTIDSFANTWNLIDSVFLVKDEITNDEKGQIQIFF